MQTNNMTHSLRCAFLSWLVVLYPILKVAFTEEEGVDGTEAANFSCAVYSYTLKAPSMNCTWNAGRTAPHDTQYFLYLKYYKKEEKECPHYIHDKRGRHIGCYFPNVTVNEKKVTLTVNGSSIESPVKKHKNITLLYELEKIGPPQNITVTCEMSSNCIVEWKAPPTSRREVRESNSCLSYQIKDEIRNTTDTIQSTSKNYPKNVRYKLRIRTDDKSKCPVAGKFGEWSEPIEFGTDPTSFHPTLLLLVVVITTLGILLLFCICKRCHTWEKLHGPIPQPKDIYLQCEKNAEKAWIDLISTAAANEKITVVEEVTANCEKHEPHP
ncbi:interleukin-5 receptor subunit alpha isoform X1 [Pogona vitticeps]